MSGIFLPFEEGEEGCDRDNLVTSLYKPGKPRRRIRRETVTGLRPGLQSRVVHVYIELSETPGALFTDKMFTISLIPLRWTAHQCTMPKLAKLPSDVHLKCN